MAVWSAVARPPATALKEIKGGRLAGMTDVNPQWRYQAMTEQFGMCGVGWRYAIDRLWTEAGVDEEVLAFAQVSVSVRVGAGWSEPIVGVGGNHLVTKESRGLRNNDECWKMAVTDALSVSLKMLGVAADVYAGRWDGSKYMDGPDAGAQSGTPATRDAAAPDKPTGYDKWLADITGGPDERIRLTYQVAPVEYRDYLAKVDTTKYAALKRRADAADAKAKPQNKVGA
jgi:hypothetical protein